MKPVASLSSFHHYVLISITVARNPPKKMKQNENNSDLRVLTRNSAYSNSFGSSTRSIVELVRLSLPHGQRSCLVVLRLNVSRRCCNQSHTHVSRHIMFHQSKFSTIKHKQTPTNQSSKQAGNQSSNTKNSQSRTLGGRWARQLASSGANKC